MSWRELLKALQIFAKQGGFGTIEVEEKHFVYHTQSYNRDILIPNVRGVLSEALTIKFKKPLDVKTKWFNGKFAIYVFDKPLLKSDDKRHSPCLDEEDTSSYVEYSGARTVLKIDYGKSRKVHLFAVVGAWVTSGSGCISLTVGDDGSWKTILGTCTSSTSEKIFVVTAKNITLRYLKMFLSTTSTMYARLRKVIIVEA